MKKFNPLPKIVERNHPGSLFLLLENEKRNVIKAQFSPLIPSSIPENFEKLDQCFNLLDEDYKRFKEICLWEENLHEATTSYFLRVDIRNMNDMKQLDISSIPSIEKHLDSLRNERTDSSKVENERKDWAKKVFGDLIAPIIYNNVRRYPDLLRQYSLYPEITDIIIRSYLSLHVNKDNSIHHNKDYNLLDQEVIKEIRCTKLYKQLNIDETSDPCALEYISELDINLAIIKQDDQRMSELTCLYHAQKGTDLSINIRSDVVIRQMEILIDNYYTIDPCKLKIPKCIEMHVQQCWNNGDFKRTSFTENLIEQLKVFLIISDISNGSSSSSYIKFRINNYLIKLGQLQISCLNDYYKMDGYTSAFQQRLQTLHDYIGRYVEANHSPEQANLYQAFKELSDKIPGITGEYILFKIENSEDSQKHLKIFSEKLQAKQITCIYSGMTIRPYPGSSRDAHIELGNVLKYFSKMVQNPDYKEPLFHISFKVDSKKFRSNKNLFCLFCQNYMNIINRATRLFIVYESHNYNETEITILSSNLDNMNKKLLSEFDSFKIDSLMKNLSEGYKITILPYRTTQQHIQENLNNHLNKDIHPISLPAPKCSRKLKN